MDALKMGKIKHSEKHRATENCVKSTIFSFRDKLKFFLDFLL